MGGRPHKPLFVGTTQNEDGAIHSKICIFKVAKVVKIGERRVVSVMRDRVGKIWKQFQHRKQKTALLANQRCKHVRNMAIERAL